MLSFVSFISGVVLFHLFRYVPLTAALLGLSAALFFLAKKRHLLILLLVLGAAYAFARYAPQARTSDIRNKELRLTGSFVPRPETGSEGRPQVFRVDDAVDEETGEDIAALHEKEVSIFSEVDAEAGEEYELLLKSGGDGARLNPGAVSRGRPYGTVVAAEGLGPSPFTVRRFFEEKRAAINESLLRKIGGERAALVAAVTTGETSFVGAGLRDDFNATGLTHLLSISGTHFGLFSVAMFGAFAFLLGRLPHSLLLRLTMYLTPRQAAALLCLPFMAFYLGLSGASPPAVRSFVMIATFLGGLLLGRKGAWLNSLLFAAFLLTLLDPEVLFSLSFQLSFAAVLFIGFAAGGKDDEDEEEGRLRRYARKSLVITAAASFGTAPLVAYHFHYFSLVSPLSNLIASPLIGSALVLLSLVSSFVFLLTGWFAFAPLVSLAAGLSAAVVRALAGIPFASVRLPAFPPVFCILFYAGFLPYLCFGRKKALLVLPFLPLAAYAAAHMLEKKELSVTFLDVGQGDSAVIEFPDGRVVVVDTGRTGREAEAFLSYEGVGAIDAVAVTHVHPDHSGGLSRLMERFHVREVWDSGRIVYPEEMSGRFRRRSLSRGDIIETAGAAIAVLHPYPEFYASEGSEYGGENESSLVLRLSGIRSSFLFAGDVEEEAEDEISQLGKWCRADVLKVPHHGSATSAHEGFLSAVSPEAAVISVGRDNSFGHPSADALGRLSGIKVYRTDLDGAVKMTETQSGLSVKTCREFVFEEARGPAAEWRNIRRLFSRW